MNDTQNQNLEKIIKLQLLFGELYDENFKTKNKEVYNAKIKDFNDELKSIGVDPNLSPKEIELKLQQIYEALEKEPLTKTTLNKDESEQLIKDSEKREADISKIKEGQEKAVEDFIKRNREKITKTQSVQEDIKDKKVYLKVEETEKTEFSVEEKEIFEQYKKEAVENPEEASIKMAREIHTRVDGVLKEQGLPQEEIENIVNKTAEKIVENIAVFDTPNYVPATMHIAINNAVFEKIPTTISKEAQEVIKSSIATNSVYRFQPDLFLKDVTKAAFGDKFAKIIFGADPNSYKISVSEIPTQQYSYTYNFSTINESSVQILNEQNQTVEILKGFGKDEARNYLINQSSAYFSKTAIGQKILSNSKTEIAFYSVFKSAGKTVTWTGGNFVGNAILKFAPEYAPVVNLLTGTKFVTPVVTQTATKIAGQAVEKAVGQVATEAVVGTAAKTGIAASLSATFAALGSWATPVGMAISAAIGWVIGKVLEKINWPKVKKWFQENGPVLASVAGLGALALGGPAVGGLVLLGGLAATGTLGTFAMGAFGVLGFIGRSVGIAIATPVIVTLLVIPPIVAFIMLVINNSAYLVPPFSSSSSTGADNPYLLVTKTAEPSKISNPTSKTTVTYTVSIKALKTALTNIKIVSTECTVTSKTKSSVCPPENIPEIDPTLSISPTSPYTFTFTVDYGSFYKDSLIYDSIEISADSTEQAGITTSGSATLCIGDCPTDCVKVSDNAQKWPSNLRSNSENALSKLSSKYQGFMSKVCSKNEEINLCYNPPQISPGYFAWHVHNNKCDVYFNEKGVGNDRNASFLITHELTHHVQKINSGSINQYKNSGAWSEISSQGFCTYSDTEGSITESMAEANGLFVSIPSWGSCVSNYKNLYPKNYMFAKKFME